MRGVPRSPGFCARTAGSKRGTGARHGGGHRICLRKCGCRQIALAKSLLQEAGIACFFNGDLLQNYFGIGTLGLGYNPLVGQVRVQTAREHVEEVKRILRPLEEDPDATDRAVETDMPPESTQAGPSLAAEQAPSAEDSSDSEADARKRAGIARVIWVLVGAAAASAN